MTASAGWYSDPWSAGALRWWDGTAWSGYTAEQRAPLHPEATFDPRALPFGVGGVVATVGLARTVSSVLHSLSLPVALLIAIFYVVVFGGLWVTCLGVSRKFGSGNPWSDFGFAFRPTDVLRGVLAFIVARILGTIAIIPWIGHLGRLQRLTEGYNHVSLAAFLVFAVSAVVGAPIFEELVFRGVLLRSLTARVGGRWAVLLQGVAFGLYHFIPQLGWDNAPYVIELACFGVVAGWIARRTRRLGPGCCAHVINNSLATIVVAASR